VNIWHSPCRDHSEGPGSDDGSDLQGLLLGSTGSGGGNDVVQPCSVRSPINLTWFSRLSNSGSDGSGSRSDSDSDSESSVLPLDATTIVAALASANHPPDLATHTLHQPPRHLDLDCMVSRAMGRGVRFFINGEKEPLCDEIADSPDARDGADPRCDKPWRDDGDGPPPFRL
jgi:hypothetical protein